MTGTYTHPDVIADNPWQDKRIPFVKHIWLTRPYEVAVLDKSSASASSQGTDWEILTPDADSIEVIASYVDFRREYYGLTHQAEMLEETYDMDSSTNTVTLALMPKSWAYHKRTWEQGLTPVPTATPDKAGLIYLLDKIGIDEHRWGQWKEDRPEIFG